jgi:4-hydroxybenzoate polyprenyltransferase
MLGLLVLAGVLAGLGPLYYLGLLAVAAHLIWQVRTLVCDHPANCLGRFRSNRDLGLLVLAAILAGKLAV